jgi:hypothetical protein
MTAGGGGGGNAATLRSTNGMSSSKIRAQTQMQPQQQQQHVSAADEQRLLASSASAQRLLYEYRADLRKARYNQMQSDKLILQLQQKHGQVSEEGQLWRVRADSLQKQLDLYASKLGPLKPRRNKYLQSVMREQGMRLADNDNSDNRAAAAEPVAAVDQKHAAATTAAAAALAPASAAKAAVAAAAVAEQKEEQKEDEEEEKQAELNKSALQQGQEALALESTNALRAALKFVSDERDRLAAMLKKVKTSDLQRRKGRVQQQRRDQTRRTQLAKDVRALRKHMHQMSSTVVQYETDLTLQRSELDAARQRNKQLERALLASDAALKTTRDMLAQKEADVLFAVEQHVRLQGQLAQTQQQLATYTQH